MTEIATSYIYPTFEYTDNLDTTKQWLQQINKPTAFDFEVCAKYNEEEAKKAVKRIKDNTFDKERIIEEYKLAYITPLANPNETIMTHLSFASSETHGRVIILLKEDVRDYVLNYLISTDFLQIWHNALFDFKYIYFYTKQFPKNYKDTRLIVKTLVNHTDNFKGNASLDVLMNKYFGNWKKTRLAFTLENVYNENMIEYAATDTCATYKLFNLLSS